MAIFLNESSRVIIEETMDGAARRAAELAAN